MTTLQGRYRLEEQLAAGGMGTVFVAIDERLGRPVAVKLPNENVVVEPDFMERFRREAHAAARLSHPNIAAVFDFGEDSGQPFIVMELVKARDLERVLEEEGALPPGRAVLIAMQVCAALDHAHSLGIVHRDIKPANVMVGEGDAVKVTDFGIARAVGDVTLSGAGAVLGSAHYISPEQAAGVDVTALSDLYSLGVVLYEMLTGCPPFTADSPIAFALRHIHEEIEPPSRLRPDLPGELDEVVRNATSKSLEARWPDAARMLDALAESLSRTSVTAFANAGWTAGREAGSAPSDRTTVLGSGAATARPTGRIGALRSGDTRRLHAPGSEVAIHMPWWRRGRLLTGFAALVVVIAVLLIGTGSDEASRGTDAGSSKESGVESGDGSLPKRLDQALDELEEAVRP